MKKLLLTAIVLVIVVLSAEAQDPAFSQFYANRLYLNPGFTGSREGLSLASAYRRQWNNVPGGFNTYVVSADIQEPFVNSAFGFLAAQDTEGAGLLTTTNIGLSYSYLLKLGKKGVIQGGIKTSFGQKSVDWSKYTFTDELDPVLGDIRPSAAAPILQNKQFVDFDAGVVARFGGKLKGGRAINSNVGFAIHHLNTPDASMQEISSPLPRRFTFHAGTMIEITSFNYSQKRVLYISPNFKFDYQDNIKVVTYGVYTMSRPMYVGILYQNKQGLIDLENTNAIILTAGIEGDLNDDTEFTMGYSYDFSTTGLGVQTFGAHEVTFAMRFKNASMFGLPRKGRAGRGIIGKKRRRGRNNGGCYQFKGNDAVNIF